MIRTILGRVKNLTRTYFPSTLSGLLIGTLVVIIVGLGRDATGPNNTSVPRAQPTMSSAYAPKVSTRSDQITTIAKALAAMSGPLLTRQGLIDAAKGDCLVAVTPASVCDDVTYTVVTSMGSTTAIATTTGVITTGVNGQHTGMTVTMSSHMMNMTRDQITAIIRHENMHVQAIAATKGSTQSYTDIERRAKAKWGHIPAPGSMEILADCMMYNGLGYTPTFDKFKISRNPYVSLAPGYLFQAAKYAHSTPTDVCNGWQNDVWNPTTDARPDASRTLYSVLDDLTAN